MDDIRKQITDLYWSQYNDDPRNPMSGEIERLRTAGDALLAALAAETLGGSMAVCEGTKQALAAWEEARRG